MSEKPSKAYSERGEECVCSVKIIEEKWCDQFFNCYIYSTVENIVNFGATQHIYKLNYVSLFGHTKRRQLGIYIVKQSRYFGFIFVKKNIKIFLIIFKLSHNKFLVAFAYVPFRHFVVASFLCVLCMCFVYFLRISVNFSPYV